MDCKLRAKNCGGCPLLGLDYAEQLKQKEEKVRALVGKYGPVHPIRGMEQPYHYRNKVISTFAPGFGGKLTSGIYAANSHKVLPVESCLLQDEVLDKTMQAVRAAANACRYQPYDEDKGTGLVRHCLLRRGVATGQVMVVLVTAQPVLPGAKNFVKALLTEAAQRGVTVTTVVQNVNSRKCLAKRKRCCTARDSFWIPSAARPMPSARAAFIKSITPRPKCCTALRWRLRS